MKPYSIIAKAVILHQKSQYFLLCCSLFTIIFSLKAQSPQIEINRLLATIEKEQHDTILAKTYQDLAFQYFFSNPDSTEYYNKLAFNIGKRHQNHYLIGASHKYWGMLAEKKGAYIEADSFYRQAIQYFQKGEKPNLIAKIYLDRGRLYLQMGPTQKDSAELFLKEALAIHMEQKDANSIMKVEQTLGNYKRNKAAFGEAIQHFQNALNYAEQLNNPIAQAQVYNGLALVYNYMKEEDKALENFEKAAAMSRGGGDLQSLSKYLNNLGLMYLNREKYDQSEAALTESLVLKKQLNNIQAIPATLNSLGELEYARKNYAGALQKFEEAYQLIPTIDNRSRLIVLNSIAKIQAESKQLDKAKESMLICLELARKNQLIEQEITMLNNLARVDSSLNNYKAAFNWQSQHTKLKDSLNTIVQEQKVNELLTQYEVVEKEKMIATLDAENKTADLAIIRKNTQIRSAIVILAIIALLAGVTAYNYYQKQKVNQLLETKNNELSDKKMALEHSLQEKEVLLKEIHHRVKNNLQLITSLLNLQAAGEPHQSIEEFLFNGQHRVKSLALIHERLYQTGNLASIEIGQYTEDLVDNIFHSFKVNRETINYAIKAEKIHLDIDQAIPLGLIINELVTNSLKHAFNVQEEGNLNVQINQTNRKVNVTIQDDGAGIKDVQKNNSMGLKLVQLLVKQLQGQLEIIQGGGTKVDISFLIAN